MPCYNPMRAFQTDYGSIVFSIPRGDFTALQLPCGKCIGCKLEYSRQWSVRIMNEASLHECNSFLTMTYDDDNIPDDFGLHHNHVQLFMKRMRKALNYDLRYYVAGEYGDRTHRPHYHMALFGCDFTKDRKQYSKNNGNYLYTSITLDKLWRMGACQIGDLTIQSASYIARYMLEKQTESNYDVVDKETGEVLVRRPPYCRMSLRPAIGKRWIEKYYPEVYGGNDSVYADGRMHQRPPRYYDKVMIDKGVDIQMTKDKRLEHAKKNYDNNTPERLAVRERVKLAQISKLKRGD